MTLAEGTERRTDRIEAFSDAVLAIAITLPIVDLRVPEVDPGKRLAEQYAELAPEYLSYALSFVVIGVYWAYSHFSGKLWRKTDHGFNLLTLLFLAVVSITPFPTRPFVEHFHQPAEAPTAATVYAAMLTAPALAWTIRWLYGVRRGLLNPHLAPAYVRRATTRFSLTALGCVAATLVCAFIDWRVGIALIGLLTLQFAWPPMTPEYKPGEAPKDDIEEADEQQV